MKTKQLFTCGLVALFVCTVPAVSLVQAEEVKEETAQAAVLEDGTYSAKFDTDSSMFHVNESKNGLGTLTVKDGEMIIHVSLASKGILNLFPGKAEDAKKEGAQLLEPTTDKVTYSDGYEEEVYGFDIPVPVLEEEFDVALIGKKGKWYDHKVSVSNPQKIENTEADSSEEGIMPEALGLEDGTYEIEVTLKGGSGKSTVESPAILTVKENEVTATLVWSSPNYDYMLVNDEKYTMTNTEGNSTFEIPVEAFDCELPVIADTVAMSEPHEIEYTLLFDSESLKEAE
jgi:hypothetical protein